MARPKGPSKLEREVTELTKHNHKRGRPKGSKNKVDNTKSVANKSIIHREKEDKVILTKAEKERKALIEEEYARLKEKDTFDDLPDLGENPSVDEILDISGQGLTNTEKKLRRAVTIPLKSSVTKKGARSEVLKGTIPSPAIEERNRYIVKKLRAGYSKEAVIEATAANFGISVQQARKNLYQTFKWLTRDIVDNPRLQCQMLSVQLLRSEELYSKCLTEGRYKEAASCLEIINKLMKLYSPDVTLFQQNNIINNSGEANQVVKFRFGGGEVEVGPKEGPDMNTSYVEITPEEAHTVGNVENAVFGDHLCSDTNLTEEDMEEAREYNNNERDSYFK